MATVIITIKERIASAPDGIELVCNNPSDVIQFDFDAEWDAHVLKTARFSWQRKYIDVPFSGNEVNVPDVDKTNYVEVGVYADGLTSTPVKIPFKHSIKSLGGTVEAPSADAYDQIIELINDNAVKGPAGDTPERGVDYWTEADVAAIKAHVETTILEGEW